MRITLSLLKEFIDINIEPKDIDEHLTMAGIEVDGIENETPSFTKVISVKVLEAQKHPSADNLKIASVSDGTNTYPVVCGAPNCRKDLITAYAQVGSTLEGEKGNLIKIKEAKLRGVESFGMLCSAKELKLFDEKETILELDKDFKLGEDLSYLSRPIFEISLTPNLGHLLSSIGVARELSAILDKKIKMPPLEITEDKNEKIENYLDVKIEDDRSKRYTSRVIKNAKVQKSPFWLMQELESCGFRSVNNIVDAINYTMLKFGHPMHAFDADKLDGKILKVTKEKSSSKFTGLDKIERDIPKDSLIIRDGKKTVAIAGIMGSLNSSVTDETKNIAIEAAHFDEMAVRKTSKSLNLKTESSMRFEKGIDPNMIPLAIDYAASLIQKISGGNIVQGKIDVKSSDFPSKKITLRVARVEKILGKPISKNEIINIFKRLEFKVEDKEEKLTIEIPTYRNDLNIEVDLIEEVARIYGYNNLVKKAAYFQSSSVGSSPLFSFERNIKSYLRSFSLQEILTCDLISPTLAEIALMLDLKKESLLKVVHYKSIEQSILRPTLLASFLEMIKYNHDQSNFDLSVFETAKTHFKKSNDEIVERWSASIALSGKRKPHTFDKSNFDVNFFDLKGMVENLLSTILSEPYEFKKSSYSALHPGRQANIFIKDIDVGIIGEVHPRVLKMFDIKKRVLFSELNLNVLFKLKKKDLKYMTFSLYPSSERDLTVNLDVKTEVKKVFDVIEKIDSKLLEKFYLLDVFKSSQEIKNVTFRFIYRDLDKTISNEEVEKEHLKITTKITKHLEK